MKIVKINFALLALRTYITGTGIFLQSSSITNSAIFSNAQSILKPSESRRNFQLMDTMTDLESSDKIYWYENVTSTMDIAKEILPTNKDNIYAVVADHQSKGRGTRGRAWISGANNLFMTISLPLNKFSISLTLIPLRIGTIIRPIIASRVEDSSSVLLKWPNDILIGSKKVCGMLMEIENDRLFIGIGCNVGMAPDVSEAGVSISQRPSTCLAEHNVLIANYGDACDSLAEDTNANGTCTNNAALAPHKALADEIFQSVKEWYLSAFDSNERVIQDFEEFMDFKQQKLRETPEITHTREVIPLGINADGSLKVRIIATGNVETLVADYLW